MPESQDQAARAALARFYDLDVADESDDVAMYLALASAIDGPVLELACGSGRIAIPLAVAGNQVTGVDNDPFMLDRARSAWQNRQPAVDAVEGRSLDLIEADMTSASLATRFDLVILGFNSILLLPDKALQQKAIQTMRRHAGRDGRVVIDVWLPTQEDLALYDGRTRTDWTRADDATGQRVTKKTAATYDPASRRATVQTTFETPATLFEQSHEVRFVTADEVAEMLEIAGLQPEVMAGDYAMNDYNPHSERLIAIAAPATRTGTTGPDEGPL